MQYAKLMENILVNVTHSLKQKHWVLLDVLNRTIIEEQITYKNKLVQL